TMAQADADMKQVAAAIARQYPNWTPDGRIVRVIPLHERLVGSVRGWMLLLLAVVGLVLLIACTNVANLMLVRATVRARDIALRAGLGASRWQLVRALLVEAMVLSFAAAALGMALAWGGVQVLRLWLPADVPRVAAIAIDLRVLATTTALAL